MWIESDKPPGINPHEFAPVLAHLCALANIAVFGAGIIPMSAWPSVKLQLQNAGYTVRKAAKVRMSADALLAELMA